MGKKLQPGKTVIGKKTAQAEGQFYELTVYFGNYTYPMVNGKFKHLQREKYIELLQEFLQSDAGKEYDPPTQQEVDEANLIVANKELAYLKQVEEENAKKVAAEKKVPQYEENVVKEPVIPEVKNPEPQYEYEDSFEDDEEEAPKKKGKKKLKEKEPVRIKKEDMDELTLMYKKQASILTIAVIFLTVVVALQMLLNLYLLTR